MSSPTASAVFTAIAIIASVAMGRSRRLCGKIEVNVKGRRWRHDHSDWCLLCHDDSASIVDASVDSGRSLQRSIGRRRESGRICWWRGWRSVECGSHDLRAL